MKLQELTTEELVNIDGGGGIIYEFYYIALRGMRFLDNLSDSLDGNSNYGNPSVYK